MMMGEGQFRWEQRGMICLVNHQSLRIDRWLEALRVAAGVSVWKRVGIRVLISDQVGRLLESAMEEDFELEDEATRSIQILRDLNLVPWMIISSPGSQSAILRQDLWERIESDNLFSRIKQQNWVQRWT